MTGAGSANRWGGWAVAAAALAAAGVVGASPVDDLPGRWSGYGSIVLASGASEPVKCVATYFIEDANRLKQNLRCASAGVGIDAVARLSVSSGEVTGEWEERNSATTGSVSGRVTGSGINLSIQGPNFSAAMDVATSACKQAIAIAPRGVDIARISISLGKC